MKSVYLVFEGGGAKGIVHVGALAALEQQTPDLDIRGIAGTSAGAIVAGLAAAGYTAEELCDHHNRVTALKDLGFSELTVFFGRRFGINGWNLINIFNGNCLSWILISIFILFVTDFGIFPTTNYQNYWILVLNKIFFLISLFLLLLILIRHGLCTTETFCTIYNAALRKKISGSGEELVNFRELHQCTGRLLKVVSTRVDTGEIVVFGTYETPDVPVAQAVAASICLPGVFEPAQVDGYGDGLFYDGGLVSNLPIWTFDEERLLDPTAITIAFEIAAAARAPGKFGRWALWSWLKATGRAAVFGAAVLNKRATNRLIAVSLPSSLRLLQFDMDWKLITKEVENGRLAATATIIDEIFDRPQKFEELCKSIVGGVEAQIRQSSDGDTGIIRAFLAEPLGNSERLLRLAFSWPPEHRTDEGSVLPVSGSLAGAAWLESAVIFDQHPFDPQYSLAGDANAKRRSLVWRDVQWRIAIPIFTARKPTGRKAAMVLCIDGSGSGDAARNALNENFIKDSCEAVTKICDEYGI